MRGVLPDKILHEFVKIGYIEAPYGKEELDKNVQPSSIDLTLGEKAYEIRGEPTRGNDVEKYVLKEINISGGATFEVGKTYMIELQEHFNPDNLKKKKTDPSLFFIHANPKSSFGRTGAISKIWVPGNNGFDVIPPNYDGEIYSIVMPKAFPMKIEKGASINQIRIYYGRMDESVLDPSSLYYTLENKGIFLMKNRDKKPVNKIVFTENGIAMNMYLPKGEVNILEAKKNPKRELILKAGENKLDDFFHRRKMDKGGTFVLKKDHFYIIATRELFNIPLAETLIGTGKPPFVAEIKAYDVNSGEFRGHAAGFVEYGFGTEGHSLIIMEVHPHGDVIVVDKSPVGIIKFYEFHEPPEKSYNGSYNHQNLTPGKYFKE